MTSSPPLSPKLFTRDLTAYSNRLVVKVKDPENLLEDFIQRLRNRAHRTSKTIQSCPVNLDQDLQKQTKAYHTLINDRGQPLHPLSLLKDIAKDLEEYREILSWEDFRRLQKFARGQKQGRFPIYIRAVKNQLKKHEFTRTFQLNKDPAQQDKLTTWIKYLGYKYWWYDQYTLSKR
ncbi:hypothetical protein K469DRAFT_731939 [Zopfia rhizophila CBS 207.26]|uniref:Uncharacterized protein n=1 Tax=Zopfia rhizophila CBS 207.26 TaxID=1314779 RepID=A0A6A6EP92_9PEZI|nr:hypothetical protein K469DRAFT_731939 [Zopfia rhizophila CBS 207.26]